MGSGYLDIVKKHSSPHLESLRDDLRQRKDRDFFWPTGTQVYVGRQGSGKTISAVRHILDLKRRYPKSIVVTNIALTSMQGLHFKDDEELKLIVEYLNSGKIDPNSYFIQIDTMDELSLALVHVNNGFRGVIYSIDEIHTYFNALDSKNIPMYVFTEISQQRKQRKVIIGTSQLFLRMAKPFREQCDNLIVCTTFMGIFTTQTAYDGMTLEQDYDGSLSGKKRRRGWFFHTRKLRNSFDTYQKVVSGAEQYETARPIVMEQKRTMLGKKKLQVAK